jgi:hypothetical protein
MAQHKFGTRRRAMLSFERQPFPAPCHVDQDVAHSRNAQENPQEWQAGGRADQRGANEMISNEDDSRREQQKYNRCTDTGLCDERDADDHIYDGRAEWNCREQAGRKPE